MRKSISDRFPALPERGSRNGEQRFRRRYLYGRYGIGHEMNHRRIDFRGRKKGIARHVRRQRDGCVIANEDCQRAIVGRAGRGKQAPSDLFLHHQRDRFERGLTLQERRQKRRGDVVRNIGRHSRRAERRGWRPGGSTAGSSSATPGPRRPGTSWRTARGCARWPFHRTVGGSRRPAPAGRSASGTRRPGGCGAGWRGPHG